MLYKQIFPHFFRLTWTFCRTPGPAAGRLLWLLHSCAPWGRTVDGSPDRHSSAVSPLLGSPSPSLPSPPCDLTNNRLIEKSFAQQILHPIQADPWGLSPFSWTWAVITTMYFLNTFIASEETVPWPVVTFELLQPPLCCLSPWVCPCWAVMSAESHSVGSFALAALTQHHVPEARPRTVIIPIPAPAVK